jgi:hypothetical protein
MVALSATALVIVAAMVVDFGLVRVDRQIDKSAADAAVLGGLNGLGTSETQAYSYKGVCAALRVLQSNGGRFSSLSDTNGTWTDGAGATTGNGCTSPTYRAQKCVPGDTSTWARYTWTGTYQAAALQVVIQSGYSLSSTGFKEDTLSAAVADSNDNAQGCFQLAVTVTQNRKPGLGSIARSSDLVSTVRSVGRVNNRSNGDAPAMLLLKQTGCPVLSTGSSGGGSYIHVYGSVSSSGLTQPGSIHADTDGSGCGGTVFEGKAANGIVAYAAPMASNPALPDPSKPGQITTYAGFKGVGLGTVRDGTGYVYGSAGLDEAGAVSATKNEPIGRKLVTRSLVDDRYLGVDNSPAVDGVAKAVSNAQSQVFATLTSSSAATAAGYKVVNSCNPSSTDLTGITAADKLYVNCTDNNGYTGTRPLLASTVVFAGSIKPPNSTDGVTLPNADHVYVFGAPSSDAIALSNGSKLSVHASGNTDATGRCSMAQSPSKAIMFIKAGDIKETGGLLQLCYTTVIAMGGQPNACLPTTSGTAPTQSPCPSASRGDGQLSQTGGDVDWTAPNQYDLMTLPNGDPDPTRKPAWRDVNGPEDLAYWSESAGNSSSSTYNINGGGVLHTVGVFMAPNADSFTIGGGGHQDLKNAQYVVTSITLNGSGTSISMRVDANSAIQLPRLQMVGLVR